MLAFAMPASAQLQGKRVSGCISSESPIAAIGKLSMRHFPGPPNYEDIRKGDRDDLVLILTLPRSVCIDDPDFDTSHKRFRTVHVWTTNEFVRAKLRRLVGHRVRVIGDGMGASNAHDRAPLVLEAKSARPY